jgi:glycosyltransferase involved in cell wall biosynthesis
MTAGTGPRVALVLASSTGGIGRHVASLAAGLAARGSEVTVYGPAATRAHFGFGATGAGFVPVEIPASPQVRDAVAVATLRRALHANRPDVVHAHGLRAGLVAGWARPARVALVVTWHNVILAEGLRGRLLGALERRVARSADITLGASNDLVTRAVQVGARDARLGAVAAPELTPSARGRVRVREELGVAEGQPLLLSVGRLHPQKGYQVLVEAAARWRERTPPPVVAIAGTGPVYMSLAGQASTLRSPVTLLGHRSDVADLLAAADLAIVTSIWEARQLFAQEALSAGVPLVATAVGGLPDLVGDAALLVPAGDVDALDAAVTGLLDDPARLADLGRRGILRATSWPTERETVDQVAAVYAELTGQPVGG